MIKEVTRSQEYPVPTVPIDHFNQNKLYLSRDIEGEWVKLQRVTCTWAFFILENSWDIWDGPYDGARAAIENMLLTNPVYECDTIADMVQLIQSK